MAGEGPEVVHLAALVVHDHHLGPVDEGPGAVAVGAVRGGRYVECAVRQAGRRASAGFRGPAVRAGGRWVAGNRAGRGGSGRRAGLGARGAGGRGSGRAGRE